MLLTLARIGLGLLILVVAVPTNAQTTPRRGIEGKPAPSWGVERWLNLPRDTKSIDVTDFEGKVVYLYCFQSWCPGCHSRGFPMLQLMLSRYGTAEDVAFVAVQTVFEGHHTNTVANARKTGERYGLRIPIGHTGARGKHPELMRSYRTGGTPWTIIIDKRGVVRFNDFHIGPDQAGTLIDTLRAEPAPTPASARTVETLPASRGGQDRVGEAMPTLRFDRTVDPDPDAESERPRATLYRWWTDGCPFCESSLPSIDRLRRTYAAQGLRVVAVYHPKPARRVHEDDATLRRRAAALGYDGIISVDADWSELKRSYLAHGRRRATSISLLVDSTGTVRFVHPGPVVQSAADGGSGREASDYALLERAIATLLDAKPAQAPTTAPATNDPESDG